MEQSGNTPMFNIPGTSFENILRSFIGNFCQIFWEYIIGMFHEYPTNIYWPSGYLFCNYINAQRNATRCLHKFQRKFESFLNLNFLKLKVSFVKIISQNFVLVIARTYSNTYLALY